MFLTLTGLLAMTAPAAIPPEPVRPPSIVRLTPVAETPSPMPKSDAKSPAPPPPIDRKMERLPALPPLPGSATRTPEVLEPQPRSTPARPAPRPATPLETEQFDKHFTPAPGVHDLTFVHPNTHRNVDVTFRLPDLPIKRFEVGKRQIVFDYGRRQVVLIFRITGQVDVRYD